MKRDDEMLFDDVIEELKYLIELFIKDFSIHIEISFAMYSQALIDSNEIIVGLYNFDNTGLNETRVDYCKSKKEIDFTIFDIDIETFTLLHEIGHLITKKEFINQYKKYLKNSLEINRQVKEKRITYKEAVIKYAKLKPEYIADLWAYNYVKQNLQKVKQFDKEYIRLRKELLKSE